MGALVRRARLDAGLTQAQLARRLGVKQPTIARMEAAGDSLTVTTARRALGALGRDLDLRAPERAVSYDETLLHENLKLTPAERLEAMTTGYARFRDFAAAVRKARDAV